MARFAAVISNITSDCYEVSFRRSRDVGFCAEVDVGSEA